MNHYKYIEKKIKITIIWENSGIDQDFIRN